MSSADSDDKKQQANDFTIDQPQGNVSLDRLERLPPDTLTDIASINVDNGCNSWTYAKQPFQSATLHNNLIISNQFNQILITNGKSDDSNTQQEEPQKSQSTPAKPDIFIPHGNRSGAGPQTTGIFRANTRDFTMCCEMKCSHAQGSRIFSNRDAKGNGIEFVAPRIGSHTVSLNLCNDHRDFDFKLDLNVWYFLCLTISHDKKSQYTIANVYVNNKHINSLTYDKIINLSTEVPGMIGKSYLKGWEFFGSIRNFKVFFNKIIPYHDLKDIKVLLSNTILSNSMTFNYNPNSLKLLIPSADYLYNGEKCIPIDKQQNINNNNNFNFDPKTHDFTITAYIIPVRPMTGGRVFSNKYVNKKSDHYGTGFEFVVPRDTTNVLSVSCNNVHVHIGETKLETGVGYGMAVRVTHQIQRNTTRVVGFLNGKQDGAHVFDGIINLSSIAQACVGGCVSRNFSKKFNGSINNFRIFWKALKSEEIATLYASDKYQREFKKNEIVDAQIDGGGWQKCRIESIDEKKAVATVVVIKNDKDSDDNKNKKKSDNGNDSKNAVALSLSRIVKKDFNEVCKLRRVKDMFIDVDKAIKVSNNVGGVVFGEDFIENKKFSMKIRGNIVNKMVATSSLSLLKNIKPFPKYMLLKLFENEKLPNKYLLNQLLNVSTKLFENFHIKNVKNYDQEINYWEYFNEYVLIWDIWKDVNNFNHMKKIGRKCQLTFKNEMFELYQTLQKQHSQSLDQLISLARSQKERISTERSQCRQDDASIKQTNLGCTCPEEMSISYEYNINVCTKILHGLGMIINDDFLEFVKDVFDVGDSNSNQKWKFHAAPLKTYERMIEKAIEYRNEENMKYPSAYQICDVNRCSITFDNFQDMIDGFKILEKKFVVLRSKNRFDTNYDANKSDGYRDMLFNVLFTHRKYSNLKMICEIQFQLKAFLNIKKKQHKLYKIIRAGNSQTLLRNYEARKFDQ